MTVVFVLLGGVICGLLLILLMVFLCKICQCGCKADSTDQSSVGSKYMNYSRDLSSNNIDGLAYSFSGMSFDTTPSNPSSPQIPPVMKPHSPKQFTHSTTPSPSPTPSRISHHPSPTSLLPSSTPQQQQQYIPRPRQFSTSKTNSKPSFADVVLAISKNGPSKKPYHASSYRSKRFQYALQRRQNPHISSSSSIYNSSPHKRFRITSTMSHSRSSRRHKIKSQQTPSISLSLESTKSQKTTEPNSTQVSTSTSSDDKCFHLDLPKATRNGYHGSFDDGKHRKYYNNQSGKERTKIYLNNKERAVMSTSTDRLRKLTENRRSWTISQNPSLEHSESMDLINVPTAADSGYRSLSNHNGPGDQFRSNNNNNNANSLSIPHNSLQIPSSQQTDTTLMNDNFDEYNHESFSLNNSTLMIHDNTNINNNRRTASTKRRFFSGRQQQNSNMSQQHNFMKKNWKS